jgi:hypothetical protein
VTSTSQAARCTTGRASTSWRAATAHHYERPDGGNCTIDANRTVTPSAFGGTGAPTKWAVIRCRGANAGTTGTGKLGNVLNWSVALNSTSTQLLLPTYRP